MDDLKIAQALGAVEGPLRALVAEAEGQGRIAGAAAEAERIWQVGKVLAMESDLDPAVTHTAFLTELRKRAVPGEMVAFLPEGAPGTPRPGGPMPMTDAERAAAPLPDHPYPGPYGSDAENLARVAAAQRPLPSEDPGFDGRPAYDPAPDHSRDFHGSDGGPLPEAVKPFDNSGAEPDVQTSKL